jgi:hypothetical protein
LGAFGYEGAAEADLLMVFNADVSIPPNPKGVFTPEDIRGFPL